MDLWELSVRSSTWRSYRTSGHVSEQCVSAPWSTSLYFLHSVNLTSWNSGLGSLVLTTFLVLLTIMSRFYGEGSHLAGAAAGVAFIFLYSACYAIFFNSTVWVVISEIFPQHLRGNGNAFAVLSMSMKNIWLSQITLYAFDAIAWKFYFVFTVLNLAATVVYWVWLPETNQLTLEEIAGAFGDEVVKSDKLDHDHKTLMLTGCYPRQGKCLCL